jgi:uncharacterized protein YgiM (DUF1202 family)
MSHHESKLIHPSGETRIVSVTRANLRYGPGTSHDVIDNLEFGTILIKIEQADDWSKIVTKDGRKGWILTALIR